MKLVDSVIVLSLAGLTAGGVKTRKSAETSPCDLYLLDSGQTGWVTVVYNRNDEKELPEGKTDLQWPP